MGQHQVMDEARVAAAKPSEMVILVSAIIGELTKYIIEGNRKYFVG